MFGCHKPVISVVTFLSVYEVSVAAWMARTGLRLLCHRLCAERRGVRVRHPGDAAVAVVGRAVLADVLLVLRPRRVLCLWRNLRLRLFPAKRFSDGLESQSVR